MTMTRERALDLIETIWGHQSIIPKPVIDEVEANKIDSDQSNLETLARIAELPEVLTIKPFNTSAVHLLCCRVRLQRQIQKETQPK